MNNGFVIFIMLLACLTTCRTNKIEDKIDNQNKKIELLLKQNNITIKDTIK